MLTTGCLYLLFERNTVGFFYSGFANIIDTGVKVHKFVIFFVVYLCVYIAI